MNNLNNLVNMKSGNILETDTMKIDKNIIKIRDRTFQISNISSISVYDKEKSKYPQWAIIFLVVGIVLMFTKGVTGVLGLFSFIVSGLTLVTIFLENSKEIKKLSIWMNNGEGYTLTSEDIEFLYKVAGAIEHCMNDNNGYCFVDFKAGDITNCNFAVGAYNSVN